MRSEALRSSDAPNVIITTTKTNMLIGPAAAQANAVCTIRKYIPNFFQRSRAICGDVLRVPRVVEAGTSFGVSTLYLAAAVRDNQVENGVVIGTEFEPEKVGIARANFREAGLSELIELREGDLRQTLQDVGGPVDFMLVDIWEVALPALERVSPSLRPGAIVVCDNTAEDADEYRDYFEFVNDPENRFRTMTVPFEGGFELTVRV